MKNMFPIFALPFLIAGLMMFWTGCGQHESATDEMAHGHDHDHDHDHGHGHAHTAPHGGTVVVLGEEQFHLEFVLDPSAGSLGAYIMDSHMEEFVRIQAESFALVASNESGERELSLVAQENRATGESVGDAAYFKVESDWLKENNSFDVSLKEITIAGETFNEVSFPFPEGSLQDDE